jgi:hypothetical protein
LIELKALGLLLYERSQSALVILLLIARNICGVMVKLRIETRLSDHKLLALAELSLDRVGRSLLQNGLELSTFGLN